MPTCSELFCGSGLGGRQLQVAVDETFPEFACERERCSPYSPGPVNDNEHVAFLLINPMHYDEVRDVVVPDAFQELTNRDLSVVRIAYATAEEASATRDELVARGQEKTPPRLRVVDEVCIASVMELRAATEQYGRLLAVYDTALRGKPSHASVFTTKVALEDKRVRKIVRERVHRIMTRQREKFAELLTRLPDPLES